ncbi:unnamed protein product [Ixodes hexagonus]
MESPGGHRSFDEFIACVCSHCELVSPDDIRVRMKRVKRTLWDNGADLNGLCSAAPNTVCWLLDILCPWNTILYKGGLGLHEEELGRLTCKTRAVPTSKELFGTQGNILEAAYLLYRLCGQHRCLQRLVIEANRDLLDAYVSVKGPCVTGFATDFALTVQRNLCALQRAVRFVLKPTTNKRAAEMFQHYEDSRELFRRVDRSEAAS